MVDIKAVAAEFFAMVLFVWTGCGSAIAAFYAGGSTTDAAAVVGIALGFGIAISSLAYSIGHISGGHINPAVTFSFLIMGKIEPVTGLLYMLAQFVGAILGAFVLWGSIASITHNCGDGFELTLQGGSVCAASEKSGGGYGPAYGLGSNTLNGEMTPGSAFIIELMGTLLLVFVVLNSAVHPKSGAGNAAPIAIGWSVLLAHLVLVPFTGCGINPARTFGPHIVASVGGLDPWQKGWWVYYTAPFVGSAIATGIYKFVLEPNDNGANVAEGRKDEESA